MKTKSNDPVYGFHEDDKALTKREYFAAMAMQGLIASGQIDCISEDAIIIADSLIEQLNKE